MGGSRLQPLSVTDIFASPTCIFNIIAVVLMKMMKPVSSRLCGERPAGVVRTDVAASQVLAVLRDGSTVPCFVMHQGSERHCVMDAVAGALFPPMFWDFSTLRRCDQLKITDVAASRRSSRSICR